MALVSTVQGCLTCGHLSCLLQIVVLEAHHYAMDPQMRKLALEYAKQACESLPQFQDECESLTQEYMPMLLDAVAMYLVPDTLCTRLGFCTGPSSYNVRHPYCTLLSVLPVCWLTHACRQPIRCIAAMPGSLLVADCTLHRQGQYNSVTNCPERAQLVGNPYAVVCAGLLTCLIRWLHACHSARVKGCCAAYGQHSRLYWT